MADFYPYLVASLPVLHVTGKPPFSSERFLEICSPFIPEKDRRVLRSLPLPDDYPKEGSGHPSVRRWVEFDTALRNELARVRAAKMHRDPAPHLRAGDMGVSTIRATLPAVTTKTSVLDAEMVLDEMRWKALDEIATGHYFDLGFLVTYALKLRILERWENIRNADGTALLERALGR